MICKNIYYSSDIISVLSSFFQKDNNHPIILYKNRKIAGRRGFIMSIQQKLLRMSFYFYFFFEGVRGDMRDYVYEYNYDKFRNFIALTEADKEKIKFSLLLINPEIIDHYRECPSLDYSIKFDNFFYRQSMFYNNIPIIMYTNNFVTTHPKHRTLNSVRSKNLALFLYFAQNYGYDANLCKICAIYNDADKIDDHIKTLNSGIILAYISKGKLESLKKYYDKTAHTPKNKTDYMVEACTEGHLEIVKFLIQKGCDSPEILTAGNVAAKYKGGFLEIVDFLNILISR